MPAPTLRIDLASPVPVFRQIADGMRALFVAGGMRPGEQIATVRRLALDLGVNHNTVAEAYRLLAEEGWLDLERGRGAMVRERPARRASAGEQARYLRRLHELSAEALAAGLLPAAWRRELLALARSLGEQRR